MSKNDMSKLFGCIDKKWRTCIKNKNDGGVFTPENNNYFMNRKGNNLETIRTWKPNELNTIDVTININKTFSRHIIDKFSNKERVFIGLYANDYANNKEAVCDVINIGYKPTKLNDSTAFQKRTKKCFE